MLHFDVKKLLPGMILHGRGQSRFAKLILGAFDGKCWGSHDGILIFLNNSWYVGDSVFPFAKLTPIKAYEELIEKGLYDVKILIPTAYEVDKGIRSATYWVEHIQGSLYDVFAFPRLLIKTRLIDFSKSKVRWIKWLGDRHCGLEWSRWCTEGVSESWRVGGGEDVWQKANPTPYTTEKRLRSGYFKEVPDILVRP